MRSLFRKHFSSNSSKDHRDGNPSGNPVGASYVPIAPPELPPNAPRVAILGAGSRGNGYAKAIAQQRNAVIVAVAEPDKFKRETFGKRYIWKDQAEQPGQAFEDWRDFVEWETKRRQNPHKPEGEGSANGTGTELAHSGTEYQPIDVAFICVQDNAHKDVVLALAPLNLHILCEKPLATSLTDCLEIYHAVRAKGLDEKPKTVFGICHVLRYTPHNMLLRKLLLEDEVIGEVVSIEHTEPVGNWHFSHSYVRGNWRNSTTSSPSLLAKSCHDIDFLLWIMGSHAGRPTHEPAEISSMGSLNVFKKARKPTEAGDATNCLSCPIERSCIYSAKRLYLDSNLARGFTGWPVKIVVPDIEDCLRNKGKDAATQKLLGALAEDYTNETPKEQVQARNWFGRCVWECDNDVCDDQFVTISWDDEAKTEPTNGKPIPKPRQAKTATLHMVANTYGLGGRRGRIYGTQGEISYDSASINVMSFLPPEPVKDDPSDTSFKAPPPLTRPIETFHPSNAGGHGGGDEGLIRQFLSAVIDVKAGTLDVEAAQEKYLGCSIEDVLRSHAVVWAAEESRVSGVKVNWDQWWSDKSSKYLHQA